MAQKENVIVQHAKIAQKDCPKIAQKLPKNCPKIAQKLPKNCPKIAQKENVIVLHAKIRTIRSPWRERGQREKEKLVIWTQNSPSWHN
jgi:hypothetical protein